MPRLSARAIFGALVLLLLLILIVVVWAGPNAPARAGALAAVAAAVPALGLWACRGSEAATRGRPSASVRGGGGEAGEAGEALGVLYSEWLRARALLSTLRELESLQGCPALRTRLEGWLLLHPTTAARRSHVKQLAYALADGCPEVRTKKQISQIASAACRVLAPEWAPAIKSPPAVRETPQELTYGVFRLARNPRVECLLKIGGTEQTLRAALRYAGMLAGAHHWITPPTVFDVLWAAGFRNEAFASPFNANVLSGVCPEERAGGDAGVGGRFYSLFPGTDGVFGSRGDWFAAPAEQLGKVQGGWIVNPPFVAPVLRRAAARAAELAEARSVVFITRRSESPARAEKLYGAFADRAKASRTLAQGAHVYGVLGPSGLGFRSGGFSTLLMYGGPLTADKAGALLDACVAAWPETAERAAAPGGP